MSDVTEDDITLGAPYAPVETFSVGFPPSKNPVPPEQRIWWLDYVNGHAPIGVSLQQNHWRLERQVRRVIRRDILRATRKRWREGRK